MKFTHKHSNQLFNIMPESCQTLTCLETVISSNVSYPSGLCFLSALSNVIVTVALVTPACPPL